MKNQMIINNGIKYLFLDDMRNPKDVFSYYKERVYVERRWDIVRDYNEFVEWIEENGMPLVVSFDHDIAQEHYVPEHLWNDYELSKKFQDEQKYKEKTGYDCAKYMVNKCLDNNVPLPRYYCHSMNPVGKDNIMRLLNKFNNYERR